MPRPQPPTIEATDREQREFGNQDPDSLELAELVGSKLRDTFKAGADQMKLIIEDAKQSPAAKVSAFRAIGEMLNVKQVMTMAAEERIRVLRDAADEGEGDSEVAHGGLVELLRQFGQAQARTAMAEAFPESGEPDDLVEVDLGALEGL